MLLRLAPLLFVLLWSTGFIASKFGAQHAEPFSFLAVRFACVLCILVPWALMRKTAWPSRRVMVQAALTGLLIHTAYLGGVLAALREGMAAGLVAILVSTQPILTAVLAGPLFGEWPGRRHWAGLFLGMIGVMLVLGPKLGDVAANQAISTLALVSVSVALLGITVGTLNQKAHGMNGDLVALTIAQYAAAFVSAIVLAPFTETMQIDWTLEFGLALAWLVIVLSIGAIGLLMLMIRAREVSRVTSLFYLVPPTTALMAAGLFGETLGAVQVVGIMLVMAAVFVIRPMAKTVPVKPA
ncbi:MAG: DMT family transporter [Alphaproteobacteria bacterium]|nr:DMT family transporter [Alphaproteobacteria bacterium]